SSHPRPDAALTLRNKLARMIIASRGENELFYCVQDSLKFLKPLRTRKNSESDGIQGQFPENAQFALSQTHLPCLRRADQIELLCRKDAALVF
ncbi:MAG: hypothetical protein AAGF13_00745, partial [Pseudomonadota bacterium]